MKNSAKLISRKSLPLILAGALMLVYLPFINAQDNIKDSQKRSNAALMEFSVDEYSPSPRETHAKSPAYSYYSQNFSIVQVNVDENGFNIVNDAANEPSIAFDPTDHSRMAIGWRQFDDINNDYRQAGYAYTDDGGQTWIFPGVVEPGVFRSDPVLRSDKDGNFFYNGLTKVGSSTYWCNVFKSVDGGQTWDEGTYAQGGDKQWMAIDQTNGPGEGNIYVDWNASYSICQQNNFTRSLDLNESYEDCTSIPGEPIWGTMFVNPTGELYIGAYVYLAGFMVGKSSTAQYPDAAFSWDFTVPVNMGGLLVYSDQFGPNPDGLLGQTIITMDSTTGPGQGNIYLLGSIAPSSSFDPCDVVFSKSSDGGLSWETPVKINDDIGNIAYQWFGTMSVAPDGRIDVVWLDTRDNPGFNNSALYYSYSMNQGSTWSQNEKLSESFNPHLGWTGQQQEKMGDYFDMYSDETGAHLAWAATFNGEQDVYYSVIMPSYVGVAEKGRGSDFFDLQCFPNPFRDQATIRYNLAENNFVTLKVYSMTGTGMVTLVNEKQEAGLHQVILNGSGLESGVYYYILKTSQSSEKQRIILIK